MSQYTVAVMRPEQAKEVHALMEASFDKSLASIFFLHSDTTLVVMSEGVVVAGLNLDVFRVNESVKMGYIGWLYTHQDHRGRGLAPLLLERAIPFLSSLGCTDVAACVEGDNPASFKQLNRSGFAPLSLTAQLRRFGCGTITVWAHASRFFDMGYFLWHRRLDGFPTRPYRRGLYPLLATIASNVLLTIPLILGWNIPSLLGFRLTTSGPLLPIAVALTLTVRAAAMSIVARLRGVGITYQSWDTAYLTAVGLPLLAGLPFPSAGNVYIAGSDWSITEHSGTLTLMALASNGALALLCLIIPNAYTLILLFLDTLCTFYPFTGFNASRIRRGSAMSRLLSVALLLACLGRVLLY